MPRGRPLKLRSMMEVVDGDGRRTRKTVAQAIYDEMEATGRSAMQCAEAIGIPRDTISQCLNDGRKLAERAARMPEDWVPFDRRDQTVLDFFRGQQAAHSRWVAMRVRIHNKWAAGEQVVGETVDEIDPNNTVVDPQTGQRRPVVLKSRASHRRTQPDLRAIEWELATMAREEVIDQETGRLVTVRPFSPRVEVTGAEGGPIQTEGASDDRARDLLAAIDAYEAGMSDATDRRDEVERSNGNHD